jgi:hypothetical protein
VRRGTLAGIAIDFLMMAIVLTVFDLIWRDGLSFAIWDVENTRINFNLSVSAALALASFLRGRWK